MLQTSFYLLNRLSCAITNLTQSTEATVVILLLCLSLRAGDVPARVSSAPSVCSQRCLRVPNKPRSSDEADDKHKPFLTFLLFLISVAKIWQWESWFKQLYQGLSFQEERNPFLQARQRPLHCAFHFSGKNYCSRGISFLSRLGMSFPFPQLLGQASVLCFSISHLH